ncbi:mechanosensitive ion channel protein 10-like [Silene latifolia]|uniref:mechanosensitive ion channel protein 10-like n=1 Tax=Silene latifolia TaxID=37657 RepID=UPI003D788277
MAGIEPEETKLEFDSISSEKPPQILSQQKILSQQNTETDSVSVKVENPNTVSEEPTIASIEPVARKMDVDSISPEQRAEILPTQNTETDSVSVKVENPGSGSEEPTENPSIQTKQRVKPKPLSYLIYCLLFVCLAPVAYAFITAVTVASLPLLLVALVFVRLFQIIVRAENYEKRLVVMILLRYWTFVVVMLLLVEVGLFYPVAKNVPGLKLVMIIGLPITKWIKIICILIGIYLIGIFIWAFLFFVFEYVFNSEDPEDLFHWESISEIISCFLVWWANGVVMSSVPIFKLSKIFGIYTQIWVKVALFVLIGYNIITLLTQVLVRSLPKIYGDPLEVAENIKSIFLPSGCDDITTGAFNKKNIVYIAIGIKRSVIFILSTVMFLITWMVYFGNRLETAPQNQRILNFGTWTFVSLLICSFLWLLKSCLLLYWGAHTVYDRLHLKIRDIGKQLYFLVMLSYEHYKHVTKYTQKDSNDSDCGFSCFKAPAEIKVFWNLPDNSAEGYSYHGLDRKIVWAKFINYTGKRASIYDIQKAAQQFLTAQNALLNENTVGDLHHLQDNDAKCIEILKEVVQVEGDPYFDQDWEMLLELLPDVHTAEDITFQKVKTFMERAHSRCMFLTNTLISENEVVKCLNQVISWIIIAVTCIMWLLLSGLAKTNVLVLIASPLLAVTFVFGDTAKNLFQGLIFVYFVHPFDVGDLCRIDEKLLEVKRIGVWNTIFSNVRTVGEQQQIIYPNSVLALKNIINHKTSFDWNDYIEFITSPDNKITEPLKHKIETYLDDERDKFTPNFHSVEILEMGDKAKIGVHIKHKFKTTEGWTNFECLKAKDQRKFEFAIYVQKLVKQLESETKTPESLAETEQELTRG